MCLRFCKIRSLQLMPGSRPRYAELAMLATCLVSCLGEVDLALLVPQRLGTGKAEVCRCVVLTDSSSDFLVKPLALL